MKRMTFAKRAVCAALSGLLLMASGCQPQAAEPSDTQHNEPVANLRAVILGTPPTEGMDELYRQLDALTIPELNCTLRFEFIPWGDERAQLNIAVASGEYDLIPNGVFSDYRTLIAKNAFLDLNDYLGLVPALAEHYTGASGTLADCEISGGLYGIPQYSSGVLHTDEGFFFREDLRKAWGLEPVTDLETMEAYLYRAKEEDAYKDSPLITDNRIWTCLWLLVSEGKYLEVGSALETPFFVTLASEPGTLVKRMETPEFQEVVTYIRKWQEDGIIAPNMLSSSDNEGTRARQMMVADLKPCETNVPFWALQGGFLRDLWAAHPDWEYGFFPYCQDHQHWYTKSISDASVISISSRTKHPEVAVRLLEKIHTDQRYYDLLRYGVEGIHYKLTDGLLDYTGIPSSSSFGWTLITDYELDRNAMHVSEKWYEELERPYDDWLDETEEQALPDPLNGFSFDLSGLETEVEEIERVRLHYFQPILCGYHDDPVQALGEANDVLNRAEFNKYFEIIQRQVTDYFTDRSQAHGGA